MGTILRMKNKLSSSPIRIDRDQALTLLGYVVQSFPPDHVAGRDDLGKCFYFDPSTHEPSCAIGWALNLAGVSLGSLKEMDHSADPMIKDIIRYNRSQQYGFVLTEEAMEIFSYFQLLQDDGIGWGECWDRTVEKFGDK